MTTTTPAIACEKCRQGNMHRARVPRMSPGLRFLGYVLWVPALLMLILAGGCGLLVGGAGTSATVETVTKSRNDAANQLLDIGSIPRERIEEFQKSGTFERNELQLIPASDRDRAERILDLHQASVAGAGLGGAAATGIAGLGALAMFVMFIPLFVVGLLLTLKKNVWKCPTCGYVFDRA